MVSRCLNGGCEPIPLGWACSTVRPPERGLYCCCRSASSTTCNHAVVATNPLHQRAGTLGQALNTAWGRVLGYWASVRLHLHQLQAITEQQRVIGSRVRVQVTKNKLAPAWRSCELEVHSDHGLSAEASLLDLGLEVGLLTRRGPLHQLRLGPARPGPSSNASAPSKPCLPATAMRWSGVSWSTPPAASRRPAPLNQPPSGCATAKRCPRLPDWTPPRPGSRAESVPLRRESRRAGSPRPTRVPTGGE